MTYFLVFSVRVGVSQSPPHRYGREDFAGTLPRHRHFTLSVWSQRTVAAGWLA